MNNPKIPDRLQADKKFTLILMILNEAEALRVILPRILAVWKEAILVVDGGSSDASVSICREFGVQVVVQTGKGIPNAEKEACLYATSDYYIIFTPDGNAIPEILPQLKQKTLEGYDMVVVSRYLDGASSDDDDFLTGLGNWLFTTLVNILFQSSYTDTLVGFRSLSHSAILRMNLLFLEEENWLRRVNYFVNSWELGSCNRAARIKLKCAEIPGSEPKRIGGVRKLSILRNGLGGLLQIIMDFFWFEKK